MADDYANSSDTGVVIVVDPDWIHVCWSVVSKSNMGKGGILLLAFVHTAVGKLMEV